MKRLILFLFCLGAFPVVASHIVGGEFELLYLGNYQYNVHLILYYDEVNGMPGNKQQDRTIYARIFRKRDGAFMRDVSLPFISETPVNYTLPACTIGQVKTSRMFYSTVITLSPEQYNDPDGYYIVWERCCRNYQITNIISEPALADPTATNPNSAGQTFYLEFPPVIKGDAPFVNSSPKLFPPLSDYGCPYRNYYADFSGTDDDGDSLVYTIVTPWDTHNHGAYPPVSPAPFPEVRYRAPFSETNIMGGSPDIKISSNGFLTVTPTQQGLYAFAVKCEEFRNGIKIGEVRRDFQLYVVDNCPLSAPPQVVGKKLSDPDFFYDDSMDVNFDNTVSDDDRCIEVRVYDPDAMRADNGFEEKVTIKIIPLDFKADLSDITLSSQGGTLTSTDSSVTIKICFPECPYVNRPYKVGVVAYDDVCSLPLTDTLAVTVDVTPPSNTLPTLQSPIDVTVSENESVQTWTFTALDADNDPIELYAVPEDFFMEDFGMSFSVTEQVDGRTVGMLTWDPECNENYSEQNEFTIRIVAEDTDDCELITPVSVLAHLKITLFDNAAPVLSVMDAATTQPLSGSLNATVGEEITLRLIGNDADEIPDRDSIYIQLIGADGTVPPYGYVFTPARGKGTAETLFTWQPDCSIFAEGTFQNEYQFAFRVYDNRCISKADTAEVNIVFSDTERNYEVFNPPNIVTPNGDFCNDYFAMEGINHVCKDQTDDPNARIALPVDNCRVKFEWISIFNRWGKLVYHSPRRDFRWYPEGESNGVYYYLLKFSDREFKGTLTVRF